MSSVSQVRTLPLVLDFTGSVALPCDGQPAAPIESLIRSQILKGSNDGTLQSARFRYAEMELVKSRRVQEDIPTNRTPKIDVTGRDHLLPLKPGAQGRLLSKVLSTCHFGQALHANAILGG